MKATLTDRELQHAVKEGFYTLSRDGKTAYPKRYMCKDDAPVYVKEGGKWVALVGNDHSNA